MPEGFDLNLLPLYRINGHEPVSNPGLLAALPPRRPARGRERDRLVVHLTLNGNEPFTTSEAQQLTGSVAATFFETPGSLTAAMRAGAEELNRALLERNLRSSGSGQYTVGTLALACLRGNQLTLLLSGPAHVFALGAGRAQHIHDPQLSGRGLGLAQSLAIYFAQIELSPGDRLLLCGQLPPPWEAALLAERGPAALDATRRRLYAAHDGDANAVLIQALAGAGKITLMRPPRETAVTLPAANVPQPGPTAPAFSRPEPVLPAAQAAPDRAARAPLPAAKPPAVDQKKESAVARLIRKLSEEEEREPAASAPRAAASEAPPARSFPPSIPRVQPPAQPKEERPDEAPAIGEIEMRPAASARFQEGTRRAARTVVGGLQGWRRLTGRVRDGAQTALPGEGLSSLVRSIMIFLAIALPLVLITAAALVYGRYGRGEQYQLYYQQAEQMATLAIENTDPVQLRQIWTETLRLLDLAEQYQSTSQSRALREQAQSSLDGLLGIQRLNFRLITTMPSGTQVTRMAASETDLYMLTTPDGVILRATNTENGYVMDPAFQCAPDGKTGPLVDLLALPYPSENKATVVGVDAAGNLLYCAPGSREPQSVPLIAPENAVWGRTTSFTLDGLYLYVLDASANAVWIYANKDGVFLEPPNLFFGVDIPNMRGAIDIAMNGADLYLLHGDGHLTICNYGPLPAVPQRCVDPAELRDARPASENGAYTLLPAHFTQLLFSAPPDSALLLMDAERQTVFRVSPRTLEVQGLLQPLPGRSNPLPSGPLTAMTASASRVLFLAVGDQVFYAVGLP